MQYRPRILLMGDSIRLSYQPLVMEQMKDRAEIVGPNENGRWAGFTLTQLPTWLEELGEPDIVHWNNGIWDSGYWPKRTPIQISIENYIDDLCQVLTRLRVVSNHVIWATTTPIHPDKRDHGDGWRWNLSETKLYNAAAQDLMTGEGVPINDLNAVVQKHLDENLADDLLHLSEIGRRRCAKTVVSTLDQIIGTMGYLQKGTDHEL